MNTRTLSATLPSDTLYVSGTVNGVTTTWTNTEGQTWQTVAERSETDVYVVVLTIINQLGTASQTQFTLYYGLHLVTDRTQADVAYAQALTQKISAGTATDAELAAWNSATLKGAYNYTDLNRVGAAMQYVAERINGYGYVVHVSPKTDWVEEDTPTQSDMQRYLADLAVLRSTFAVLQSTPAVPADMEALTYTEANNIEKILEDIDYLLANTAKGWFYSGEVFSGED